MLTFFNNVRSTRILLAVTVLLPALALVWLIAQTPAFNMPTMLLFCALAAPAFVAFLYAQPAPANSNNQRI